LARESAESSEGKTPAGTSQLLGAGAGSGTTVGIGSGVAISVPVIATEVGGIGELLNSEYDYLVSLNFNTPNLIWDIVKNLKKPLPKEVMHKIKFDYDLYVREVLIQHRDIYMKLSQQAI
jgi:hypothetical protein